jgi:NAD(P)H-flavin reductase
MRKVCKVTLNNESFYAKCGDLLLDSAIMNGVELTHDCRSGICGSCRVRLIEGKVYGGTESNSTMIHACQARIVSDLRLVTETTTESTSMQARVASLVQLAPDIVGVCLKLPRSFPYLPGQYCKLQFRGFPARCYSPSYPLEGGPDDRLLHLHIRRFPRGTVSSAIGEIIRIGHRVTLSGPFGSAFLRPNHPGRIVLVASGTGFAPMWSIAVAAITERPQRPLVFVTAARKLRSFYMDAALCRLALFPNVTIIPVVEEQQNFSAAVRSGRPTDYLPVLSPEDVVYAAGSPTMTARVIQIAEAAGANSYTDPFLPDASQFAGPGWMSRVLASFDWPRKNTQILRAA